MHITHRNLATRCCSEKPASYISDANVAASGFKASHKHRFWSGVCVSIARADTPGPDFTASGGKFDDAIDVLRDDASGPDGNFEIVAARYVNLEIQIIAAIELSHSLRDEHDAAGRAASG
jgi:hypothetical protein